MAKYKVTSILSSSIDPAIAAGTTVTVGKGNLFAREAGQVVTFRVRASARAGGGTVTAKLWHGVSQRSGTMVDAKDMFDTGLSVVIAAADTDYFITHVMDATDTTPLVLLPYIELRVTTVTGTVTIEEATIIGSY